MNGNDDNDGRSAILAFKTIVKAQTSIRGISGDMKGDITVYLRGGTHSPASTLVFSERDSGVNGHNIIYQAYPGETPVISGGMNLSGGWSLYDKGKNIYRKTGVPGAFRQLYIDGDRRIRARHPNLTDDATGGPYLKAFNKDAPFRIDAKEIGNWARNGRCEFVWLSHWSHYRCRISDYATQGAAATVLFKSPEAEFDINHHSQARCYYYFENAYKLLDAEGEWFLDEADHALYYKPRSGENMAAVEVIAPSVRKLIRIEGKDAPVHNLQFRGITFKHDNWIDANDFGYISMQGGQVIQTVKGAVETDTVTHRFSPTSGMICLKNAQHVKIERNAFALGGSWGIMEFENCGHNSYVGNCFSKLAGGAIVVGNTSIPRKWYEMPAGQSSHDLIGNNLIDGVSRDYMDSVGILALKVKNATIENNEIRNLPYTGISVGFEWDDSGSQDSHDNIVRCNRIHRVSTLLDDGGGIYALGKNVNSSMAGNFAYDLPPSRYSGGSSVASYYLDRGSCYWTLEHNVSDFAGVATFVKNTPNHDNIGRYLYFNGPLGKGVSGYSSLTNIADCTGKKWPAEAIAIVKNAGIKAPYADIGNVTFGANLAVEGKATASSTLDSETPASMGNDNDCSTGFWASDKSEANPYWRIDLGTACRISEIDLIAGRTDGQSGSIANFEIAASNDSDFKDSILLDSVGDAEASSSKTVYSKIVDNKNFFRYVRIQRINGAGHFGFSECRIFGIPKQ
ncbi:MAG: discoidin domain-containing protein [Pirellulales bacterium]|nr:discoidin domain-containing protein [Pirellulales bacterium]